MYHKLRGRWELNYVLNSHLEPCSIAQEGIDLTLSLGDVLRADQTLFTLKLKAGAAVLFSRTFGATIGLDYYPIVGDVYFGEALNLRTGLELFL